MKTRAGFVAAPAASGPALGSVQVWDGFVRAFHWATALGVGLNLWVLEEGERPHRWIGYALCALVVLRGVWGFVGSPHARFADFWPTRARLDEHWRALRLRQPDRHPGHNPLGALVMLALLALVLMLGLTGWLQGTDAFWGEEWLEELHEALAGALQALVALHVAAAFALGWWQRTPLVGSMITGRKPVG